MTTQGLLLAAGAGRRMGMPKALVRDEAGRPWLTQAVQVLLDGGCDRVSVVLGAAAEEAQAMLDSSAVGADVAVVRAHAWQAGMGASLRAGLAALEPTDATAALIHLVDLPDVTAEVVARVLAAGSGAGALARASYDGRVGHPVLLGRDHWVGVVDAAAGDRGARRYLEVHDPVLVECGDLATGTDVDTPPDPPGARPTSGQRTGH